MTRDHTLQRLFVTLSNSPGTNDSRTFTVRVNGADTSLAVTISGTDSSGSNIVDNVPVVQGDFVSVLHTDIGNPNQSSATVSFEYS